MSLYDIIQNILDVSKNHNLVREVGEGDIYNYLNSSEHQYPCVFLTVSSINDDLNLRNVNCTLFYVDRLTSDESNKILVQSLGLSVLSDIVERIAGDVDTVEYTTFTEKFTDLCGGVYASLSIGYPLDGACSNDFEVRELEVTENGVYDVLGYDRIVVSVKGPKPVFKIKSGNVFRTNETEIPFDIDSTEITDFSKMFERCSNLTTIPQLDTSNGTSFGDMFNYCENLITIPQLDTSNGIYFSGMFDNCTNLTSIPQLDTSNGTTFMGMFIGCEKLTTIPQLDTSNGTRFDSMFANCDNLTIIPQLDTSNGTNFSQMFSNCVALKTIPQLDTSNGTNFINMFSWCLSITEIPQLDTSNGTNFREMFYRTLKLKTISQLDLSKGEDFRYMFWSSDVENIHLIGSINYSIDFNDCTKLTYESVKSILTACSNTTNTSRKTVIFNRTLTDQNGELAALVATCNTKGWTVSGLTLQ